ncbi:MAG TPA: sigma-70 family RNA polymerase sigma factor [Sedimentisphaerales bacterium]|nr:sigma-70 family RNA polymerase sigma factor [Sedimentisphaerales bacterium]
MNHNNQTEENMKLATRIYNEHADNIRQIIRRQVNDPTTVDDILHDFFLSLIRRPISPEMENIKGYLYQAVHNDIIDAAKKKRNYNARITRYAKIKTNSRISPNPQKAAIKNDEIHNLFNLINNKLPHREATAVLQRYQQDQTTAEAAKAMNIDKRSFSRYICIGLKKLREAVGT